MRLLISAVLIAVGLILLYLGNNAQHALNSQVHHLFTGNPSDRATWLLLGGAVLVLLGIGIGALGFRKK